MTLVEIKKLITDHDLTYSFSDSGVSYERGDREYKVIKNAIATLTREDKAAIIDHWNQEVSRKLVEDVRKDFEWSKE